MPLTPEEVLSTLRRMNDAFAAERARVAEHATAALGRRRNVPDSVFRVSTNQVEQTDEERRVYQWRELSVPVTFHPVGEYVAPPGGATIRFSTGAAVELRGGQRFVGSYDDHTMVDERRGDGRSPRFRSVPLRAVARPPTAMASQQEFERLNPPIEETMRQQFEMLWEETIDQRDIADAPGDNPIEVAKHRMLRRFEGWKAGVVVEVWWIEPSFRVRQMMMRDAVIVEFAASGWLANRVPKGTPCIEVPL